MHTGIQLKRKRSAKRGAANRDAAACGNTQEDRPGFPRGWHLQPSMSVQGTIAVPAAPAALPGELQTLDEPVSATIVSGGRGGREESRHCHHGSFGIKFLEWDWDAAAVGGPERLACICCVSAN